MTEQELAIAVEKRHQQYQDGAITLGELLDCLRRLCMYYPEIANPFGPTDDV